MMVGCEYTEYAVVDSLQGVVLRFGGLAAPKNLSKNPSLQSNLLHNVTTYIR